jgi:hypothetical protein
MRGAASFAANAPWFAGFWFVLPLLGTARDSDTVTADPLVITVESVIRPGQSAVPTW